MAKPLNLTDEQVRQLLQHPEVKHARHNRVSFTFEFRDEIYKVWNKDPSNDVIRKILLERGFDLSGFKGTDFINDLSKQFKRKGQPSGAKNKTAYVSSETFRATREGNEKLLATGRFVRSRNGIAFAPEFIDELYHAYPGQTIEEGLNNAGIAPEEVGYQRIYHLQRLFDGCNDEEISSIKTEHRIYPAELREQLECNPFIKKITAKQIVFNDTFFHVMSSVKELHIDDILDICGISPGDLSVSRRNALRYKLLAWDSDGGISFPEGPAEIMLSFYKKLSYKLASVTETGFTKIASGIPAQGTVEKRKFMMAVSDFCDELSPYHTRTDILKKLGISRNCFYSILKNAGYGTADTRRKEQDKKDAEAVKAVLEYKGIRKGSRQIHMQMQELTGRQLSLKKIRRLMKEYGMDPGIRKKTRSGKAAAEMVKKHKKPNLVKRRFRLHRPGELTLTDVTYLKYGAGMTAYASALLDPVTGKLLCFNVSGSNDLPLVMESLDHIDPSSVPAGAVFHSDQGTLYMTETFQGKVAELGFTQSMSRRGNCWDNSPQENFFGSFKCECPYKDLETVGELAKELEKYADYWNNERKQWNRKRMTPVRYEEYMNSMTDEEYAAYYAAEEERYRIMNERAVEKATERAACFGAGEG